MEKFKTICAIVINEKGEVLLIKRGREPYKNHWALISGTGESKKGRLPEVAVIGEVNCDLSTNSFKGKCIFSVPVEDDEFTDEVIIFAGKVDEKEIKINPGFSEDFRWVSLTDAKVLGNLAFEHSRIIAEYLKRTSRDPVRGASVW